MSSCARAISKRKKNEHVGLHQTKTVLYSKGNRQQTDNLLSGSRYSPTTHPVRGRYLKHDGNSYNLTHTPKKKSNCEMSRAHRDGNPCEKMLTTANRQRNADQNHQEMPPHTCQSVNKQPVSVSVEEGRPRALLAGLRSGAAARKEAWTFLKTWKIEAPCDPAIPFLVIYTKKNNNNNSTRYVHPILTAAEAWKQPKSPSLDVWIQMWYTCTTGQHSATTREAIPPFAAARVALESVHHAEWNTSAGETNTVWS